MISLIRPALGALTLLAVSAARAADADKPGQSGELKNIVIEGVSRIQMRGDKPPHVMDADPQKPLGEHLAQLLAMNNPVDKLGFEVPTILPAPLDSDLVLTPWRRNLIFSPVLQLDVKAPPRIKLAHWRFIITDDRGNVFRVIKGKNTLPERMDWDGLSTTGQPMEVGHPYAYSLSLLDRSGVPTYMSGKSVQVSSYVMDGLRTKTVFLQPDAVFHKGYELSARGIEYMREIQDALREDALQTLSVNTYASDAELARRQSEAIRKYLESNLHLKAGSVSAQGHLISKGGYNRTEISAR